MSGMQPGFDGRRFAGLLKAAAIVTAVFSLATFADHLHRYLELFSHFRLQYLVVALLLGLILLTLRSRAWASAMFALAVINALPVAMWYLAEPKSPPSTVTVKLLLANVYANNRDSDRLIELVSTEDPDFVFLQEVDDRWIASLAKIRTDYPNYHEVQRGDKFGIAVYAREPLVSIDVVHSPPFDFPTLVLEANIDGTTVTLVSTHPPPPIGDLAYAARNEQLASIGELLANVDGPKILIGDLNTTMWGHNYDLLLEKTGLQNSRYGFGVVPTWPSQSPLPLIPIDHCLISDEFAALDTRSGPRIGSDHLPLIVEIALLP